MTWRNQWLIRFGWCSNGNDKRLLVLFSPGIQLISLFSSQLAETAADGFYIVLSDCPDVLSNAAVCNSRVSCCSPITGKL